MRDVIVVGARCAGAPLAMLLARAGRDVVLIDRARFPSDTTSTHFIQPRGTSRLARWGLEDRLVATATQKIGFPEADSPVSPPIEVTLGRYAPDRFVITDGPRKGGRVEIIRHADGSIGWLRIGGRIHALEP